ncbi:MAG: heparinase II/III family protein [Rhodocyclaceae bacterium]|nr:heparinase II/III family protein [Rhodocyclaceae bacterium]MDZ4214825.1 heparinase II/III family protein [Rhodocyclaceae bacterium]
MRRDLRALMLKAYDCFISTYCDPAVRADKIAHLFSFANAQFIERLGSKFPDYPELVRGQAENSMAHRFDLLGSGPVVVRHGMRCPGLNGYSYTMSPAISRDQFGDWLGRGINRSNRSVAKEIWRRVDEGYVPIDWQIDFKSGFRWSERTWYRDVGFGNLPGVDVKVPWELSRMQHLPTLALASCFASAGFDGFEAPDRYAREFRNQILDFIATNPPRFGVNWACAMDVAIRVANWLVAYDIIAASGIRFDDEFDGLFAASVRTHARHISANLEWSPTVRGNHYIANILGLLFSSIYLPCDKETNTWLAFSIHELISEVDYQFHEDGSNFEGSVCYHRLSAEMVTWASALIRNLVPQKRVALRNPVRWTQHLSRQLKSRAIEFYKIPGAQRDSPLPEWFWERLARMATFTNAMTKPDGLVVQFGDNDSGRFIVLGSGEQLRAGNDSSSPLWSLDHRSLIAGVRAVVDYEIGMTEEIVDPAALFLSAIRGDTGRSLTIISSMSILGKSYESNTNEAVWLELIDRVAKTPSISRFTSTFKANASGLLDKIQYAAFPGIGVYVMQSPRFYVAVRCGEIGLAGLGGHTHCDQLAIELVIDGITRIRDPGTLIYTPLPDQRNTYRSAMAHHVPRIQGLEPADLTRGVFDLRDCAEGQCLYFGPRGFIGRHAGYGAWVYRIVALENERIVVYDFSEGNLSIADPTPDPLPFSPGYGRTISV